MNIETENIPRKLEGKFGAMVVCCILGVGQLVAWNTILTISDYYYQVFPEYHPSRVLTLVYQPFVLGTIFILVFMGKKKKNQKQIAIGYTIFFIGSLLLIILDVATKGEGTLLAYIFLCSIVACFGMANAHVEGAMLGELSFMCPEFIQSFVAGLGVAGAITSALRLVTKAVFDKSPNGLRKGALLFLAFSTLIEFICMLLYIYMYPLVLVASYNVWDAFSRYIPLSKHLKIESIKWITSCVLVRFLFVPAFYFTAKSADQGWMVLLTSLLGLTNGYLTVCVLANKPKSKYNVLETDALGNLLVSFMLGGIFAGVCLGWLWLIGTKKEIPSRLEGKNIARVVCCILGLGSLVAWNAMLTITDYYYQVFPKYHPSRVLTIVYQLVANVFISTLAYKEAKLNTRFRNILGYSIYTAGTFCLIILDLASHGSGSVGAYVVLCLIVALFGLADAFVQGGMVGDLSFMCPEFIQAFMGGLGIAGALTSGLRLITKAIFDKSSDVLFIGIATLIELGCLILYVTVFAKLPIVKYYRSKAGKEGAKSVAADLAAAGLQEQAQQVQQMDETKIIRLTKKQLLRQNIDHGMNIFMIYVVTLSIFPGFLYENTGEHRYAPVLIAMYNGWDSIARFIPSIKILAMESRKWITGCVIARFLLVPAFYFTAKYADQGWMIFLTSFLGLSNGYLTVCIFSIAPKGYNGPESNALGNLLCVFLLGGIFAGVCLGWLWLIGNGSF
ncbi:hypothetical protein HID58_002656 [Brassica napus]|uniref:Uncharacterized protein n=1 Tax=Brassica napus TaxID=3708 RepID=A0ABQ8EMV6_BRANA|nr:hypothetical protein HID58_002656 [Brassica napus]